MIDWYAAQVQPMGTGVRTARVYQFGAFTVDARTGELSHAGRRTPLRDQSVQLLLALLEKPGELITREELAGRLWAAGTFVDFDRGLNKAINHLREALGDSAEQPNFIETLPRKGYRFIAPVTCAGGDVAAAAAGRCALRVESATMACAGDGDRCHRYRDCRRHRWRSKTGGRAFLRGSRLSRCSRWKTCHTILNNSILPTG